MRRHILGGGFKTVNAEARRGPNLCRRLSSTLRQGAHNLVVDAEGSLADLDHTLQVRHMCASNVLHRNLMEHLRYVGAISFRSEAPDEAGIRVLCILYHDLRGIDDELIVHRRSHIEEMAIDQPVHRLLDGFHDFGNTPIVYPVGFDFRLENINRELSMNVAEWASADDQRSIFRDRDAPFLGLRGRPKTPFIRDKLDITFENNGTCGMLYFLLQIIDIIELMLREIRPHQLRRSIGGTLIGRKMFANLVGVDEVSLVAPREDGGPAHPLPDETKFSILETCERNPWIRIEVIRRNIIGSISFIAFDFLRRLKHLPISGHDFHLHNGAESDTLLALIVAENAEAILAGIIKPEVIWPHHLADLDLIRD